MIDLSEGQLRMRNQIIYCALVGGLLLLSGCLVGPNYTHPPAAPVPEAFKEKPPDGWKEAQPNDTALKGKWWEIYNDPRAQRAGRAGEHFESERAGGRSPIPRGARRGADCALGFVPDCSRLGPTASVAQGTGGVSANQVAAAGGVHTTYQIPFDVSYQVDLWGSIRRNVRANAETAQATEAQLENAKLTYQADLAQDYFQLHGTDGDIALLQSTVDVLHRIF